MKWIEVQIKTTKELEEIASNIMYDMGVTGLAIEDPNDILDLKQSEEDWDFIEPELLNQDYDEIIIKAYFPEDENLLNKIELVRENIETIPYRDTGKHLGEVSVSEINDADWAEEWKKYFKPVKIGEKIVIKPTWEEYNAKNNEIIIELDPGMAFGTGTHETTMLCIEALEEYINEGDFVYDVGCGSGILSIVAAKLGADKVVGIDSDESCVKISKDNVKLNKLEDKVEIIQGDLLDKVTKKADIIVSNIVAEVIVEMINKLRQYINNNGIFIASGIIPEKLSIVKDALIDNGFEILEEKKMNDWRSLVSKMK